MKATMKIPKTGKGWFSLVLVVVVVLLGSWPIISFFNRETLLFGMPLLMTWSIFIIFLTSAVLWFIGKIGVDQ